MSGLPSKKERKELEILLARKLPLAKVSWGGGESGGWREGGRSLSPSLLLSLFLLVPLLLPLPHHNHSLSSTSCSFNDVAWHASSSALALLSPSLSLSPRLASMESAAEALRCKNAREIASLLLASSFETREVIEREREQRFPACSLSSF